MTTQHKSNISGRPIYIYYTISDIGIYTIFLFFPVISSFIIFSDKKSSRLHYCCCGSAAVRGSAAAIIFKILSTR